VKTLPRRYQSSGPPVNPDATSAVEYVFEPETEEPRFRDYWKMVVKRRRLIILAFLVVFGGGVFKLSGQRRFYTQAQSVLIEIKIYSHPALVRVESGGEDSVHRKARSAQSRTLAARGDQAPTLDHHLPIIAKARFFSLRAKTYSTADVASGFTGGPEL